MTMIFGSTPWDGDYDERDAYHPEAYSVYAFGDVVGIVCSSDCGDKAVADIVGDHGDSEDCDAGIDVATKEAVNRNKFCMGCGKEVV